MELRHPNPVSIVTETYMYLNIIYMYIHTLLSAHSLYLPSHSPQSRLVAAGSVDGGVYIWNAQTGKLDRILKEHRCGAGPCRTTFIFIQFCLSPPSKPLIFV